MSMYHTLVIDLDNTIYPESSGLMQAISARINLFMLDIMGLNPAEINILRTQFKQNYGTTLQGLYDRYKIDKNEYLAFVHDIDISQHLSPDDRLPRVLETYPQKKVIFSNADRNHINKVLDFLDITSLFDLIIDVHAVSPFVKPQPESFDKSLDLLGFSDWSGCVFIDDYLPNIQGAVSKGLFCIQVNESLETEYPHKISRLCELPEIVPAN